MIDFHHQQLHGPGALWKARGGAVAGYHERSIFDAKVYLIGIHAGQVDHDHQRRDAALPGAARAEQEEQAPRHQAAVERHNAKVDDWNARCAGRPYRKSDMDAIEAEADFEEAKRG